MLINFACYKYVQLLVKKFFVGAFSSGPIFGNNFIKKIQAKEYHGLKVASKSRKLILKDSNVAKMLKMVEFFSQILTNYPLLSLQNEKTK